MQEIVQYGIPLVTFVFGVYSSWSAYTRKRYAAQRDFQELMENYEDINDKLTSLQEMVDRRITHQERVLIEIKTVLYLGKHKDL